MVTLSELCIEPTEKCISVWFAIDKIWYVMMVLLNGKVEMVNPKYGLHNEFVTITMFVLRLCSTNHR